MNFAKRSRQPEAVDLDGRDLQRAYQEWGRVQHHVEKAVERLTLPGRDPKDPFAMCPACFHSPHGHIPGAPRARCARAAHDAYAVGSARCWGAHANARCWALLLGRTLLGCACVRRAMQALLRTRAVCGAA